MNTNEKPTLLPCPFCGGEAAPNTTRTSDKEFIRLNGQDTYYAVNCIMCGAWNKGIAYGFRTPEKAVEHWNSRPLAEELEKSRDAYRHDAEALMVINQSARQALEAAEAKLKSMTDGSARIVAERQRQVSAEGWTPEHDAEHVDGELAEAAACYAMPTIHRPATRPPSLWPWDWTWWKPSPDSRIRELEKAGALCAAEIDRLLAAEKGTGQ